MTLQGSLIIVQSMHKLLQMLPASFDICAFKTQGKAPTDARGMFITDYDGTLRRSDGSLNPRDVCALENLAALNAIRVLATGRSLYSLQRGNSTPLPVDFIIFSNGAGITRMRDAKTVRCAELSVRQVRRACDVLWQQGLDFMIHRRVPRNHYFAYRRAGASNPDFEHRIALYRSFGEPLADVNAWETPACQLLAIVPPQDGPAVFREIRRCLNDLSVIRTTSPLDQRSVWIEIFASAVSKSRTAAGLAGSLGIPARNVLAVGNDYNDIDLLQWAGTGVVVANAPTELKTRFGVVASNDHCGVAEAAAYWRKQPLWHN